MNENSILRAIAERRSTKPEKFNGNTIDSQVIWKILEAANWAPTHGYTEPWRFVVFHGARKADLAEFLDQLDAKLNGANAVRVAKRARRFDLASHVVAIAMKRGDNPKIPELEELLATAMAVQNMWLAAHSLEIAAYWGTGSLTYHPEFATFLGLNPESDKALGLFYLGLSEATQMPGIRLSPIAEKVSGL